MNKYLILAQYTKSKKNIWWDSSDDYNYWRPGKKVFLPGTTTEVEIIASINMYEIAEMKKAIADVYDMDYGTDIARVKERLDEFV